MSMLTVSRSALVLSTTPPTPREYGNRNRVRQTLAFLREAGFGISFLLYPLDQEWEKAVPPYYRELVDSFEYFAVVPNTRPLHRLAEGEHHLIDEWWDESIGQHLSWLFQRKSFDVLLANYTFMSKALTYASRGVTRILDTHDVFTGRREIFGQHGVAPEFFYTTSDQEKIAYDRADAILAIKSSEGAFIRDITSHKTITVPYWDDDPVEPPQLRQGASPVFSYDRPLRVGFIGARNSVNAVNMSRFLDRINRYYLLYNPPIEIIVAGNVCTELQQDYSFLTKLGRVESVGEFYRTVDAIVAPLEFSTGMKIKVGEALVWQLPVLATENAYDGFQPYHHTQAEESVAALCDSIVALAFNEIHYADLVAASQRSARAAQRAQDQGFSELRRWLREQMRRILVVVDQPFWRRDTFLHELVAQGLEFISQIGPTLVVVLGYPGLDTSRVWSNATFVTVEDTQQWELLLAEIRTEYDLMGAVLFMAPQGEQLVAESLAGGGVPTWKTNLILGMRRGDFRFKTVANTVVASALRYAPTDCEPAVSDGVVAIFRPELVSEWEAIVLDHLEACCVAAGLETETITVPWDAASDPEFFRAAMASKASRIAVLASDDVSRLFVLQAARYRTVQCLILGEDFIFPQVLEPEAGRVSVAAAIDWFVSPGGGGLVASDADTGWGTIWTELEAPGGETTRVVGRSTAP